MAIYLMQILMINLDPFSQDLAWPQSTFCVITFEPIKILTHYAHQNDCLNLSFVKDINTVGKKETRNGPTGAIYKFSYISKQSISESRFYVGETQV